MKYYEVAAKWWADKIRNVGPANYNNGDNGVRGGMAMMMATMIAVDKAPSNVSVELFEKKLAEKIKESVESRGQLSLDCDYGPNMLLGNIARETEIDPMSFPWKTNMHITPDKVQVSFGYGAGYETIFPVNHR